MADFCFQCVEEDLGFKGDKNDLKNLCSKEDNKKGLYSALVICEGCGPIQVDCNGKCISENCLKNHN